MPRKPSDKNTKFNPNGNYTWDADQEFTVYGKEIDLWNKTFNIFARDPQFEKFLYLQEALKMMQGFFQEAVSEGLITEIKPNAEKAGIPVSSQEPKNLVPIENLTATKEEEGTAVVQ